jgi:hypothetical protein
MNVNTSGKVQRIGEDTWFTQRNLGKTTNWDQAYKAILVIGTVYQDSVTDDVLGCTRLRGWYL